MSIADLRRKMYLGYLFHPERSSTYDKTGLEVQGGVCWALAGPAAATEADLQSHLVTWDERGYKIGLLIKKGQRIERLAYARVGDGEVVLRPDPSLVSDLHKTLGTPAGAEWVGFVFSAGRRKYTLLERNIVRFEVTLRITPAEPGPQLVPVVSRHLDGTFEQSYMPGLWVLPRAGA
ncbi:MAG: hypothetical protein HYV93_16315 [Candidatus Rokubacteria bacterium]|nr:hypothetical protein [Candidatus Rokubacteria bacterium]